MATTWGLPDGSADNTLVPGKFLIGNRLVGQIVRADVTSYITSGETLTPGQFGMFSIIWVGATSTEMAGYTMRLNQDRTRFLIFIGDGTELGSGADGGTWDLLILGVPGY